MNLINFKKKVTSDQTWKTLVDFREMDHSKLKPILANMFKNIQDLLGPDFKYDIKMVTQTSDYLAEKATHYEHVSCGLKFLEQSQDIKFLYEKEYAIGRYALFLIEKKLNIKLPLEEASFISLHIINAEARKAGEIDGYAENKVIINKITKLIENKFNISINKDGANYSRFVSHIQYLLRRIESKEEIKSENKELYITMKKSFPDTSDCVDSISEYLLQLFKWELSIEEKLYLIIHINRLCSREDCYQ